MEAVFERCQKFFGGVDPVGCLDVEGFVHGGDGGIDFPSGSHVVFEGDLVQPLPVARCRAAERGWAVDVLVFEVNDFDLGDDFDLDRAVASNG